MCFSTNFFVITFRVRNYVAFVWIRNQILNCNESGVIHNGSFICTITLHTCTILSFPRTFQERNNILTKLKESQHQIEFKVNIYENWTRDEIVTLKLK